MKNIMKLLLSISVLFGCSQEKLEQSTIEDTSVEVALKSRTILPDAYSSESASKAIFKNASGRIVEMDIDCDGTFLIQERGCLTKTSQECQFTCLLEGDDLLNQKILLIGKENQLQDLNAPDKYLMATFLPLYPNNPVVNVSIYEDQLVAGQGTVLLGKSQGGASVFQALSPEGSKEFSEIRLEDGKGIVAFTDRDGELWVLEGFR